jgi:hypothetical protein
MNYLLYSRRDRQKTNLPIFAEIEKGKTHEELFKEVRQVIV